jgi:RNA polymerase sigma factor (sigma-70 family)
MITKRLTEKQKKLIVRNRGLLSFFINQNIKNEDIPRYLEDEFISDSFLGFCYSALKFDEDKGFKFSTYACYGLRLSKKNVLNYKRNKISRTFYYPYLEHSYVKNHGVDRIEQSRVDKTDLNEFISTSNLDEKEIDMISSYFYQMLTFSQVGKLYGMSGEMARLIVRRALQKLRDKANQKMLGIEDFYV